MICPLCGGGRIYFGLNHAREMRRVREAPCFEGKATISRCLGITFSFQLLAQVRRDRVRGGAKRSREERFHH